MIISKNKVKELIFPINFLWGSATAAHQVEGNNTNNNWWEWEQEGGHIADGSVSGIACDQYNRFKDDIQLMKELGHQCYRFSLEWSRIEPKNGYFDANAIDHYRDILTTLIENDITPMVTLHHFTNPIWLQKMGAWENPEIIDLFERYTIHVAEELGDLIPFWNTINEPMVVALLGYLLGTHPPNKQDMGTFGKVAVNLLKSHGKAYNAIHRTVKSAKRPQVGIVHNVVAFEPYNPNSAGDKRETKFRDQTFNWWILDSIESGIIKAPFGKNEEEDYFKNSTDFIGMNYYFRFLMKEGTFNLIPGPGEKNDMGNEIYPEGLFNLLVSAKKYNKPIYITENGICTSDDRRRCKFILQHLMATHRALQQGVDVKGYIYWSTLDNFEWAEGFAMRFGLVEMNYDTLERIPRPSAYLYRDIIQKNRITKEMQDQYLE
jgi:beta-glucosidase